MSNRPDGWDEAIEMLRTKPQKQSPELKRAIRRLRRKGFIVGKRDPNLVTAREGRYMIAEAYERGLVTDDYGGKHFCMVGNELGRLVTEMELILDGEIDPDWVMDDDFESRGENLSHYEDAPA